MNAIIVSDLHMGSRFFLYPEFERFFNRIPYDGELILNGDLLDNPKRKLPLPHRRLMDRIESRSHRQKVIWVQGNHDNGFVRSGIGNIEVRPIYHLDRRLLIAHGHDFDELMPKNRAFMRAFKFLHEVRILLGAKPVHVAHYAKRWKRLYGALRDNVMRNAVLCARENGYEAVCCGHTHYPEDRMCNGIRYINTGAWTEYPPHCLWVTDTTMGLKSFDDLF